MTKGLGGAIVELLAIKVINRTIVLKKNKKNAIIMKLPVSRLCYVSMPLKIMQCLNWKILCRWIGYLHTLWLPFSGWTWDSQLPSWLSYPFVPDLCVLSDTFYKTTMLPGISILSNSFCQFSIMATTLDTSRYYNTLSPVTTGMDDHLWVCTCAILVCDKPLTFCMK